MGRWIGRGANRVESLAVTGDSVVIYRVKMVFEFAMHLLSKLHMTITLARHCTHPAGERAPPNGFRPPPKEAIDRDFRRQKKGPAQFMQFSFFLARYGS
jgi:hypothetical protein